MYAISCSDLAEWHNVIVGIQCEAIPLNCSIARSIMEISDFDISSYIASALPEVTSTSTSTSMSTSEQGGVTQSIMESAAMV